MRTTDLPMGSAPLPAPFPHFPDRLHAFVWRNWQLVPAGRLARVVKASSDEIQEIGRAMGLSGPPSITRDQERRSALTVIRRNWHLLPYEQLLVLLDWTPERLAFTLREDDFLFIKLGSLKPRLERLEYRAPDEAARQRAQEIARVVAATFPDGVGGTEEPLFGFVADLSGPFVLYPSPCPLPEAERGLWDVRDPDVLLQSRPPLRFGEGAGGGVKNEAPRFCHSYFALYGDTLLDTEVDPYPDGYLARLADAGVNGIWLQGVLYALAPFPWDPARSLRYEERRENLRALVARARRHGIEVYLYLNEPRAMPLAFYETRPELKGVVEGDHAALCTSDPSVRQYLTDAVASLCRDVPELGGLFTITASENLTSCWSYGRGEGCPRCGARARAEVIAEVIQLLHAGIRQSGSAARLIAWDWGWPDDDAEAIIERLPDEAWLMSVSEWSIPIERGGVASAVGEYAISVVGPGPRARSHWESARRRGLRTIAKIQAANTWELSAVPYIPAVANVARHAANLTECRVDGLMLGWTLGGYPSPNLEVVAEVVGRGGELTSPSTQDTGFDFVVGEAMLAVARRRFGDELAPAVVAAWQACSVAFGEFPYHVGVVYQAPLQLGSANLLWEAPTGYRATMVGFPYDDLDAWRAIYPPEVFIAQLKRVAEGFEPASADLKRAAEAVDSDPLSPQRLALAGEIRVIEATAIHYRSVANQARFVQARRALETVASAAEAEPFLEELEQVLTDEITLAARLHGLQSVDSRIGFEASNQYFYVPMDLAEKVLNARDLRDRWLPEQRSRFRCEEA